MINQWTIGAPSATSYLVASGFSRDLLVKYKNSGWLEPFGRGAYIRTGDKVDWPGALYTLQNQISLQVHAGGKTAIKVKRLFLYMAEQKAHPWLSKLDLSKVDLGKGKRMIVRHGRFDAKYRITVPATREGTTS